MDEHQRIEASADILSEFLEVAIHNILHCRQLYPPGVFCRKKKYNVPVQICAHPEVAQYVSNVCCSIRQLLITGAVSRVDIVLIALDNSPLERFVFEIHQLPYDIQHATEDHYLLRLEQMLRSILLKINVSETMLQPLKSEYTWTVHVHTKESSAVMLDSHLSSQDFPWVEADERERHLEDPCLVPLRSVSSHLFRVQLYVEESGRKGERV